ncbi:hypothetical protein EWM59_21970 [Emticicia agri]|uniref:Mutator family transposase n=1 Tax=Emticicia agri TaxID=2492393 RepID=A0A4Q5LUW5_9BACT|nr:hypothetical protein EWM59_21970 [Emticicia agri]
MGKHLQEIYGYSLSASELTSITDKVLPMLREWQMRPLSPLIFFLRVSNEITIFVFIKSLFSYFRYTKKIAQDLHRICTDFLHFLDFI